MNNWCKIAPQTNGNVKKKMKMINGCITTPQTKQTGKD